MAIFGENVREKNHPQCLATMDVSSKQPRTQTELGAFLVKIATISMTVALVLVRQAVIKLAEEARLVVPRPAVT